MTGNPQHTPGPWETYHNGTYWEVCARGDEYPNMIICDLIHSEFMHPRDGGGVQNHSEANARLIAAAPDLADALEAILPMATSYLNIMPDRRNAQGALVNSARAALAKAGRGE